MVVGENTFELSIPPFLGFNPGFNMDLLQPHFPQLLDTSKKKFKLTPIDINPNFLEQETIDWIMDM